MSRVSDTFERLRGEKRKALVIFLTAGDPGLRATVDLAKAASGAGADIIELGVPFSDPLADGPVIQESFHRAIKRGANLKKTLAAAAQMRKTNQTPLVFMLASTLVIHHGVRRFMRDCSAAGVDGVILPDVPCEEAGEFIPHARASKLDTIMLAAPTSPARRLRKIVSLSRGFVYYINVRGVTGKQTASPKDAAGGIARLKKMTRLPVVAGFGVTRPEQARELSRNADGIVIGSQAIRVIRDAKNASAAARDLARFVRSIRKGLDG